MIQWLVRLFKKEKEENYPQEFAIVTYNDVALRSGIEDTPNKIIIHYKYNEKIKKLEIYSTYGYSQSLMNNLKLKMKIPIYDKTYKETIYPVYEELNLDEISYKKG